MNLETKKSSETSLLWSSLNSQLLSKDDKKLNRLINTLKKERFSKYITHSYLVYTFNNPGVIRDPKSPESLEIIPNFLKSLLLEKVKSSTSKEIIGLEIGSFQGLGAKYMIKQLESIGLNPKIHSVDLMMPYFEELSKFQYSIQGIHLLENTIDERMSGKLFLHSGKSRDLLPVMNVKADFVYVDGEHTSGGVYLDLVMSLNQLNTYGVIIIDDVDWKDSMKNSTKPGIKMFLEDFHNKSSKGYDVIVGLYSLSKKVDDNEYKLYEQNSEDFNLSFLDRKVMKTKQLVIIAKQFENTINMEDVKAKGLYFS